MYRAPGWYCEPVTEANAGPMERPFLPYLAVPHERCTYTPVTGLGAGPGETVTYLVDLPLPWGRDTEVTLPIEAVVNDAWDSVEPRVNMAIGRGVVAAAAAVALAVGLGAWWIRSKR